MNALEVDARGLRCPLPVIRLAEAARDAAAGTRITVLASDPAARHDIPAWCRLRDHELVELTEMPEVAGQDELRGPDAPAAGNTTAPAAGDEPAYLQFVVVLRAQRPKAPGVGSGRAAPSRAR